MVTIPELRELPAAPRRIIWHWTGGGSRANDTDKRAYHYIVEHDGTVVAGDIPVAANMQRLWNGVRYARHTGGMNSFSVGIAFAGMKDSRSAQRPGPSPLNESQVRAGLRFTAACCVVWNLDPLNPAHCFCHREAWELHGVKGEQNDTKPDITYLPFLSSLGSLETREWLRRTTAEFLTPGAITHVPGERRWSRIHGWIILTRFVSDREWYFVPAARPHVREIRAGALWSHMPRHPLA
jgi:hypothetical protein